MSYWCLSAQVIFSVCLIFVSFCSGDFSVCVIFVSLCACDFSVCVIFVSFCAVDFFCVCDIGVFLCRWFFMCV